MAAAQLLEVFKNLQDHGVKAVALHGNVHPKVRKEAYEVGNKPVAFGFVRLVVVFFLGRQGGCFV